MKKIIITILASFIGMSAMAATIEFINDASYTKINARQVFLKFEGYGSTYQKDKGKYTASIVSNGTKISHTIQDNADQYLYIVLDSDLAANASTSIALTYENGDCGVANFTGNTFTSSTACGGAVEPEPEPAGMLPVIQANSYFEGTGLFIKIDGWSTNPADTYYSSDDYTIVPDQSNTLTLGARTVGHGTHLHYKMSSFPANDDVINRFTVTHDDTGNCAVLTFTGYNCTAVEACGGAVDPDPEPEPSTIQFTGITINGAGATITSSVFNGTTKEDYTVEAFEGNEENQIDVTLHNLSGDWILVNKSGEYNNYPYKFIITKNDDGSCGIITATSNNDGKTEFTQSACTSVSITEVTPGVDYIDLAWSTTGYSPTHAYVLYKKATDANFTSMVVAINKPTARITGLAANTNYVVKVRLEQKDGEGAVIDYIESEQAAAKTAAASMSLKQVGAYTNYLTIGWDVNFTAELYTVMYRKNGSKEEYLKYQLSGSATSATITGLDEHTAYEVQVVAQLSAAQGGSRTASGVFTTLDRTSCNTVSYETETEDNSFTGDDVCAFNEPYEVEAYTTYDANQTPTIRIRYHYTQGVNEGAHEVWFLKREPGDATILTQIGQMTKEGKTNWYYQDITDVTDGDYFYFAVKAVTNEACTIRNNGTTKPRGGIYVTRKLNYKVGVGCNDATQLTFYKGEGDKVFYLQSNATIARVEVYNPSGQLVDTPEITKPGPNYVLNIADDTTFPTGTYTFMLYDINGRLSDIDLVYTIY